MNQYLVERVKAASAYAISLSEIEKAMPHPGIRGRFRELLIDNLITPWLPPYVQSGTGMIIDAAGEARQFTQDDIILYDKSIVPPILSSASGASEGVFLYNSVIARIEVKSKVTRGDLQKFTSSSSDIAKLKHSVRGDPKVPYTGALNFLFAYDSDAVGDGNPDYQLHRMIECMHSEKCDPLSGVISMICIPKYGFWKLGADPSNPASRVWFRLNRKLPEENLAWFVAVLSNSCFREHAIKQGRGDFDTLEGGIGNYFPDDYVVVETE